jgi:hypothetical protein
MDSAYARDAVCSQRGSLAVWVLGKGFGQVVQQRGGDVRLGLMLRLLVMARVWVLDGRFMPTS